MKSVGEQAKEFRLSKGWNTTRMGKEVGTSRQNIEHLEAKPGITPHYIVKLATAMGVTVDDLLSGKYTPQNPGENFPPNSSNSEPNQVNRHVDSAQAAANVVANPLPAKLSSPQFSELAITVANLVDQVPKSDDTTRTQMLAAVLQVWQVWIAKQQQQSPSASDQKKPSEQLQPLSEPRQQYLHRYVS